MADEWKLEELERKMNKALSIDIFKEEKKQQTYSHKPKKRFPEPRPRYTKQYEYEIAKREIKSIAKGTGQGVKKLIRAVKNRKIRKLEKEAITAQEKAQALAHKIKTLQAKQDALLDIARYEKELQKVEKELADQNV